jgi:hypothetical protein
MTEDELREHVLDLAASLGLLAFYKGDSRLLATPKGFPDLVLAGPGGVLFREIKTETGRLTDDQARWIQMLRRGGADVKVWQPVDWIGERIQHALGRLALRRLA